MRVHEFLIAREIASRMPDDEHAAWGKYVESRAAALSCGGVALTAALDAFRFAWAEAKKEKPSQS